MMNISTYKRVAGCPAELLVIQAMAETAAKGHLHGLHVTPDCEIIIVSEDGVPVSFVVFEEYDDMELWIILGYCLPEYRRQGHYRKCITELRAVARDRGYSRIHTAADPTNHVAQKSIEARGGTVLYVTYTFPVSTEQ